MTTPPKPLDTTSPAHAFIGWYASPVGACFVLGLAATVVLAVLSQPVAAIVVLAITVGVIVPWKLSRQLDEIRTLASQVSQLSSQVARLENNLATTTASLTSQLSDTVAKSRFEAVITGLRSADRKREQALRERLLQLERADQA